MSISPIAKKISDVVGWLSSNLVLHLLLLIAVALKCLPQHAYRMFNGLDGVRKLILARHEWLWMHHSFYQGQNIFQGMGNVFYGFNLNIIPVYFLQLLLVGHIGILTSYILFSLQCFLTAYIWTRLFCFSRTIALSAGWILVISTLPFLPSVYLSPQFQTVPQFIDLLFFSTLFLYFFRQVGRKGLLISLFYCALLILIVYYLSVAYLYFVIISVPVLAISVVYFCFITDSRKELIFKLVAGVVALGSVLALEVPQFLYGLTFYTAFGFFMNEMPNVHTQLADFSLLFQYAQGATYPFWVLLGFIGAFFALTSQNRNRKRFAILHIILTLFILFAGLMTMYLFGHFGWRGPQGTYYEMVLWPSYVAYSVYAVVRIFKLLFPWLQKAWKKMDIMEMVAIRKNHPNIHFSMDPSSIALSYRSIFIFLIPLAIILFNHPEHSGVSQLPNKPFPQTEIYPPRMTPMVSELKDSIALQPGALFKGYAATFTPAAEPGKGISWHNQVLFDCALKSEFGNGHRLDGLWYYDIPTLNEYSHLITPPLYLLGTRLLSRPIDEEDRTSIIYSVPNINLLRMLGVRFIITNSPKKDFSSLKDTRYAKLKQKQFIDKKQGFLYLYVLASPNLGNYSPTHYFIAKTGKAIIALMKKSEINYEKDVIVSNPLPKRLIRATNINMRVGKFGIHIEAKSSGVSTLLLPIQYSHCLNIAFNKKRPQYFSMQRANLVETLLVFSGKLDANLSFATGPLHNPSCRIADLNDMKRLKIKQTAYS